MGRAEPILSSTTYEKQQNRAETRTRSKRYNGKDFREIPKTAKNFANRGHWARFLPPARMGKTDKLFALYLFEPKMGFANEDGSFPNGPLCEIDQFAFPEVVCFQRHFSPARPGVSQTLHQPANPSRFAKRESGHVAAPNF